MSNILIDGPILRERAGLIRTFAEQVIDDISKQNADIDTLVGGEFKGKTADGYKVSFDELSTSTTTVGEALEGMAKFLEQTADNFETTDNDMAAGLGG